MLIEDKNGTLWTPYWMAIGSPSRIVGGSLLKSNSPANCARARPTRATMQSRPGGVAGLKAEHQASLTPRLRPRVLAHGPKPPVCVPSIRYLFLGIKNKFDFLVMTLDDYDLVELIVPLFRIKFCICYRVRLVILSDDILGFYRSGGP